LLIAESLPASRVTGRGILTAKHTGCLLRCLRLRCAPKGRMRATLGLGFDTCLVSPCAQDLRAPRLYPSSSLPALTPCSCPLQVSRPGRVPVLEISLSPSPVFDRNLWSPFTRRTCLHPR